MRLFFDFFPYLFTKGSSKARFALAGTINMITVYTRGWFTLALLFTFVSIETSVTGLLTKCSLESRCACAASIEPEDEDYEHYGGGIGVRKFWIMTFSSKPSPFPEGNRNPGLTFSIGSQECVGTMGTLGITILSGNSGLDTPYPYPL